jgi:predicted dehydrogenase
MGGMGWFHASKYAQMLDRVAITAIADVTPERLEAKHAVQINIAGDQRAVDFTQVQRYNSGSELIARADVDVVDICLPSYLHAQHTIAALQRGKHVLCEKPMALSTAEAQTMVDAAQANDRLLMVAQCIRFWAEFRFLRDCVRDGRYGKLLSLNMSRIGGRPIWSWQNWFLDPARSGGPAFDLHIHDVDYVHYLLGKPTSLFSSGRRSPATGAHDVIHTVFNYADGPQVHIHAGWSKPHIPFIASYDAWFENGFVRLDSRIEPTLQVYENPRSVEGHAAEYDARFDAYYNEIAYFIECVQMGVPPAECPPESARDSIGLVENIVRSIETNQIVTL